MYLILKLEKKKYVLFAEESNYVVFNQNVVPQGHLIVMYALLCPISNDQGHMVVGLSICQFHLKTFTFGMTFSVIWVKV